MSENLITMTVEELEALKEEANKRADELEWKLRLTLTKVRELEKSIMAALGETQQPALGPVPERFVAPVIRTTPSPVVVPVRPAPAASTPPAIAPTPAPIPAPRTTAQRPTLLPVPAPAPVVSATRVGPPPLPPAALAAGSTVSKYPPAPPAKRAS